jgi:hypothetical protein
MIIIKIIIGIITLTKINFIIIIIIITNTTVITVKTIIIIQNQHFTLMDVARSLKYSELLSV